MRLCFGTFVQALMRCCSKAVEQTELCCRLFETVLPSYEMTDIVNDPSRFARCERSLPKDILRESHHIGVFTVIDCVQAHILPLLNANMHKRLTATLIRIIQEDSEIQNDTSIYRTRSMTKTDLLSIPIIRIEEFLGNVFLYAVCNVDNREGKTSYRAITDTYVKNALSVRPDFKITSKVLPASDDANMKERWGAELIAEARGTCTNRGCSNSLLFYGCNEAANHYEVIAICDDKPKNDINNLIAVCPKCAKNLKLNRDDRTVRTLMETKKLLARSVMLQQALSDQSLESDIVELLRNIPNLSKETTDLNYTPVELAQKMQPESYGLLHRLKLYVNLYFNNVHETLQTLNVNGSNRFEPFCTKIRLLYLNLSERESDQEAIFDHMVEWLQRETNGKRNACEIVIAYFVQKCEVFDAIPE